ncbi:hypothetical protein R3P38DRAFT_3420992 [Favolaschia claudopus]|uniref:F-box domain-containing protein n=1 Tax=Favolaschia claudopus TaxID=2862362 RepID=A0AAW0D1F1_9AGAR
MSSPAISNEIRRRIAQFCATSTLLSLTLVNQDFRAFAEFFLYQYVRLPFPQALQFFRSLHTRPILGSYVRLLHLHRSSSRHQGTVFRSGLASMTNLRLLYIMGPVDFQDVLFCLDATLRTFRYGLPIDSFVRRFLSQQQHIFALSLYYPLYFEAHGEASVPLDFLPSLREIEARHFDVHTLIDGADVHSVKFVYPHSRADEQDVVRPSFFGHSLVPITELDCLAVQLLDYARLDDFLPALQRLIVRPDIMWGVDDPTPQYPGLARDLVLKLRRLSSLRLFVVATRYRSGAVEPIQRALNHYIDHFHRFVFHTHNRCLQWDDFLASPPIAVTQRLENCYHNHCLPHRMS